MDKTADTQSHWHASPTGLTYCYGDIRHAAENLIDELAEMATEFKDKAIEPGGHLGNAFCVCVYCTGFMEVATKVRMLRSGELPVADGAEFTLRDADEQARTFWIRKAPGGICAINRAPDAVARAMATRADFY